MKKKGIIILGLIVISILVLAKVGQQGGNTNEVNSLKTGIKTDQVTSKEETSYLLDGYPIDEVPLYKLEKVSSNKIFVNTDPKNVSTFGGANYAYYNIVLYTKAGQEEFLNYYKNLFEREIKEEFANPDMVKGTIGEYKVTAAYYGSDNTGYIQVYLPDFKDEEVEKYFIDYPNILETSNLFTEHEKSYGLLNQKGGEEEFTKYFTVIDSGDQDGDGKDDVDEFLTLEQKYKELYGQKPEYSFDEESGTLRWKSGNHEVTLVLSRDHGRIYVMLRKGLNI